ITATTSRRMWMDSASRARRWVRRSGWIIGLAVMASGIAAGAVDGGGPFGPLTGCAVTTGRAQPVLAGGLRGRRGAGPAGQAMFQMVDAVARCLAGRAVLAQAVGQALCGAANDRLAAWIEVGTHVRLDPHAGLRGQHFAQQSLECLAVLQALAKPGVAGTAENQSVLGEAGGASESLALRQAAQLAVRVVGVAGTLAGIHRIAAFMVPPAEQFAVPGQ